MSEVAAFPAPPGVKVDLDHPQQQKVLEHYLIFGIGGTLATIALAQRFYTKIFLSKGLQMDDAFMTLGWAAAIATQGLMVASIIDGGMCAHVWEMTTSTFERYAFLTYIAAPVYMLCNGFTKLSLLTFYLRLSPQRWFRISVWISIVVVCLYTGIITMMMFFHCHPIRKAWDIKITEGSCLDAGIFYMATAVSNIISDIVLFILPLPTLFSLRMKMALKIGAAVLFAIGSMTVATSIVRLYYLPPVLKSTDVSWDSAPANIWTFIEGNLFVICGSMPTLRKFFKHFAPKVMGTMSNSSEYALNKYNISAHSNQRASTMKSLHSRQSRLRKDYEQFSDDSTEMPMLKLVPKKGGNGRFTSVVITSGEEESKENLGEKATWILQTKTITVQHE
ncbi:putative integral membrane protein [Colletotrichum sublineola]|uniref:Putative integral membrane protein n=1 Tax=Colletotrichum sublineola TaxID=1173701 RepID=A0A066XSD3_COLSU|nr:putative integral membrane protein [Colletotrichum sublineola]